MSGKRIRSFVALTVALAVVSAAWAAGADLLKGSITSPNINVIQPLLTVVQYDKGYIKRRGLLEPDSRTSVRLQAIVDGSGWRPTLVTFVPVLHFQSESTPGFTIDVSPTQVVANYETLGIRRQKVRSITQADYDALLKDVDTEWQPIVKKAKKSSGRRSGGSRLSGS